MNKVFKVLSLVALLFAFASCGSSSSENSIVSDFSIETSNDGFLSTEFALDLGATQLPDLTIPLGNEYGFLSLYNDMGQSKVSVEIDVAAVTNLPNGEATLPNGSALPVRSDETITLDIEGLNARVYLAKEGDIILVGFAISIAELDNIGDSVGTIGVFPTYAIGEVSLTAGLFTSATDNMNGLAAFATFASPVASEYTKELLSEKAFFAPIKQRRLSRRQKRRVYKKVKKLLKRRKTLTLSKK